jgi:hypothetical protein
MGCSGSTTRKEKFKICVAVDGSEHSEFGLKTIVNRHKPNEFLKVIHITDNNNTDNSGLKEKEIFIKKLEREIEKNIKKDNYKIIVKDKSETDKSIIELLHSTVLEEDGDLLVVGSKGEHGEKFSKKLTKGVEYLVNYCKIPTFVINFFETDIDHTKGKNWLFSIKNESNRSFRSLEFSFNIIDKKKDTVIGLHLKDDKWPVNRIKTNFDSICSRNGIRNYEFVKQDIDISKNMTKNLLDYLFFSQKNFDFIVLNNNIRIHGKINRTDNLVVEMLKYGKHNILYCRESI